MSINDGGPAFPVSDISKTQCAGLSLRDYFAAHAPAEPAAWFDHYKPKPTRPRPKKYWGDEQALIDGCQPLNSDELAAYDSEQQRLRLAAWPWAWADAVLAARAA